MRAKKLDQALLVLKLNVEAYPSSANTWDSLGEVYMDRGDKGSRSGYASHSN